MIRWTVVAPLALLLSACGRAPDMPANAGKFDLGDRVLAAASPEVSPVAAEGQEGQTPQPPPKRIIHNARLELRVDDFTAAEKQIVKLVRETSGYIAEFREHRSQGKRTSGEWVTRIPVDKFEPFLAQLDELGIVENKQLDSHEVTEEFVDLQSRLASKQKVEQRVAEILEKRAGDVRDVIAVETELGRVREEIERIQGRLRYLADRTEMTTVTVSMRETQDYRPEPTTFAGRVSGAFHESWQLLLAFGETMLIAVVVLTPWALVALAGCLPLMFVAVRLARRPARRPA